MCASPVIHSLSGACVLRGVALASLTTNAKTVRANGSRAVVVGELGERCCVLQCLFGRACFQASPSQITLTNDEVRIPAPIETKLTLVKSRRWVSRRWLRRHRGGSYRLIISGFLVPGLCGKLFFFKRVPNIHATIQSGTFHGHWRAARDSERAGCAGAPPDPGGALLRLDHSQNAGFVDPAPRERHPRRPAFTQWGEGEGSIVGGDVLASEAKPAKPAEPAEPVKPPTETSESSETSETC